MTQMPIRTAFWHAAISVLPTSLPQLSALPIYDQWDSSVFTSYLLTLFFLLFFSV
jgi:hypothetical protein